MGKKKERKEIYCYKAYKNEPKWQDMADEDKEDAIEDMVTRFFACWIPDLQDKSKKQKANAIKDLRSEFRFLEKRIPGYFEKTCEDRKKERDDFYRDYQSKIGKTEWDTLNTL